MRGLLTAALVIAAGCSPNIAQNAAPSATIVVEFDPSATPPVVPTPNDLAISPTSGNIVVPTSMSDSAVQTEFNQQYLGGLNGFPYESTASVLVTGALDPSTVSTTSIIAIDLTAAKTTPAAASVALSPTYDATTGTISIPPPGGAFLRAHQYAVAVLAGAGGLRGANGEAVIGSPAWELVSSPNPLVNCPNGDLSSPSCTLAVDVIPSKVTDPTARLADQLASALALERIREGYQPILAEIEESKGLTRAEIPILWTFTIVDAGEVTFDPANGVIPFPNDVLRTNGQVALPNPLTGQPLTAADCANPGATVALYCGLNTLDGFSTIAAPISENSNTAGAVEQANIDPTTLNAATVGLVPLATSAPPGERTPAPSYVPCLNCVSSLDASGMPQTSPQQLQWQLTAPLDEKTTYLAWVTNNVHDDTGKGVIANPVFALVRLVNPLIANGHSTVNIINDQQAAQLEPLRLAMKPALDALAVEGVPRTSLSLAWAFTTQSEGTQLDALVAYPPKLVSDSPLYVYDATAQYQAIAAAGGITNVANLGRVLVGVFTTPVAVTGPGGTLDLTAPEPLPVTFTLTIPAAAAPATGYPVTIFGHGFTRSREDFLAIAGALADPALGPFAQATLASDVLLHGERTSCTGSAVATMQGTDDAACADPTTQMCNEDPLVGRCVARNPATLLPCRPGTVDDYQVCAIAGQGACASTGVCEGGDFLRDDYSVLKVSAPALIPFQRPVISGWNIFSLSNFFSTRDNFRQQVVDLAQLVRIVKGSSSGNLASLAGVAFDPSKFGYVGQSLGGILGTLFNAVSPDTTHVVLNVPGGDLPQIILNAPSFAAQKAVLLETLATQGIMVGTPAFDQFIGITQWILDPADPANLGWRLTHPVDLGGGVSAPNALRSAFLQFIEGDETVPNVTNLALVMAADRPFSPTPPSFGCVPPLACYEFTEAIDGFDTTSAPLDARHGFLLAPPSTTVAGLALTTKAQTQVASFLASGQLQ